jgi:hypothetical protein
MALNDSVTDGLTRHNISLMRYDAKLRRQIRGQLRRLQQNIVETLGNYDFTNVTRRARLEGLLKQVDVMIKGNYTNINRFMAGEMGDLAVAEHAFGAQQLNSLIGVDIVSAGIAPATLRALGKNAPIFGAPAAEHWGRQSANLRRRFADEMRQGFLLGESTQDLVRRVRGTATGARQIVEIGGRSKSVAVFSGGIMNVSTREAEALVRTSVQSVANDVRLATYMANTDVIQSVITVVTLDTRTSDICQSRGNRPDEWTLPDFVPVGSSSNYPGPPPWHFNCRSSLAPNTKSWEDLQGQQATRNQRSIARKLDNNAPKATRASMNGQVAKGLGYGDWLKKQPKSVQVEAMGPTRQKLWKDGKLELSKTLDQTGRPMSLAEMGLTDGKAIGRALPVPTPRRVGLPEGPDAFVAPPRVPTVTNAGLTDLTVGQQFTYLDDVYKVHKVTATGVEALPWSTRTGKFVSARNRKTLAFKSKIPVKPPAKPPTTGTTTNPKLFGDVPDGVVITKADDFEFTGTYRVKIPGHGTKEIFRDQGGTGWWYESMPTGTSRFQLGFNAKEGMAGLLKKYPPGIKPRPPIKPPIKPPGQVGTYPGKVNVVAPENYRNLKVDDIFTDGTNVYKVYGSNRNGVKVIVWSDKSNRFLSQRNGRTLGYSTEKAGTVKQFKQSTANAAASVKKLFVADGKWGQKTLKFTRLQLSALEVATSKMGKNGFNKVLADMMSKRAMNTSIFNMTTRTGKLIDAFGGNYGRGRNVLGAYWNGVRALGIKAEGNISRMVHTWTHEFGHHIDYVVFRNRYQLLRTTTLSAEGEALMLQLDDAYKAMLTEYRAASKSVGKELGLRMKGGIMSEGQQSKNWGAISRHINGRAQSSYSLHNDFEWFAETFAAYFDAGGSRSLMAKWQPATHEFYRTLFSKDMELLWKELFKT